MEEYDIDLCGYDTRWGIASFGEAGAGVTGRVENKPVFYQRRSKCYSCTFQFHQAMCIYVHTQATQEATWLDGDG